MTQSTQPALANREGQSVPAVNFMNRNDNEWEKLSSDDLFAGKKVIVFALPGAFTPTCSSTHLPRYNELAPIFKNEGVDDIICMSVNDAFVMQSWQGDQNAENIRFIADGNGDFAAGMGMLVDKSDIGFGKRSWRYSMLVNDGVIEKMFIEEDVAGDPFKVSDADTILNYINAEAKQPARITVFSKLGCPHCARAKAALADRGMAFEEISLSGNGLSYSSLQAVTGQGTTPQIYVDGERIGGADDLENWLK
jgi:glutathione-dependent peroxiredoxin